MVDQWQKATKAERRELKKPPTEKEKKEIQVEEDEMLENLMERIFDFAFMIKTTQKLKNKVDMHSLAKVDKNGDINMDENQAVMNLLTFYIMPLY